MKRIWGIAFLFLLTSCSLPLMGAKNSQGFSLTTDVRIGDLQIPQGQYNVTWTEPSGSQVQLTLKADGKKPITIPARLITEKHAEAGVTTFSENGVTYVQDFHTTKQTFILAGTPSASRADAPKYH
ncbi:MAG TPA: hypothetical protein VHW70_14175 [Edaphobacter sp.]|nr:hypothetical protein [Edaphobacter sp.]